MERVKAESKRGESIKRSKKGVTLVEISVVLAVFMVILAEVIAFSAMIRLRTLKAGEIQRRVNGVLLLAEVIRADFETADRAEEERVKLGGEEMSADVEAWGGYYLNYACGVMENDHIRTVTFRTVKIEGGEVVEGDTNSDMIVCEIEYYKYATNDASRLGTYTLVLSRKSTYTPTEP